MFELDYLGVVFKTKKSRLIIALCIIVLLIVSVSICGSWWRWDGFPTPEEWSALFTAGALLGVLFAWRQLKQVDASNRALEKSNEESIAIGVEQVRPRVIISLRLDRGVYEWGSRYSNLHIDVVNRGLSAASNVRIHGGCAGILR